MTLSKTQNRILWTVRILLAAAFAAAGAAKLTGAPMMIEVFEQVGVGQWFRYLTGAIELGSAVLLLVSSTSLIASLLLTATMVGAVITHVSVIGGSPVPAIVLLALSTFVVVRLWPNQGSSLLRRVGLQSAEI